MTRRTFPITFRAAWKLDPHRYRCRQRQLLEPALPEDLHGLPEPTDEQVREWIESFYASIDEGDGHANH
jgi:hypothetical protein